MSDARDEGCGFHGYIRWYAAAAGSLLPLSGLPILEADSYDIGTGEWSVWSLASYDRQGWVAAVGVNLMLVLFVLLVATSLRPVPRSRGRVVAIATIAAPLTATLLAVAAMTDKALTGVGLAAAVILLVTAVRAGDHALHLTFLRRRANEPDGDAPR